MLKEKPRILSFKEKKELESLPVSIEALEAERDALFISLADPEVYRNEAAKIPLAKTRLEALEKEITSAYGRWEVLEEIRQASALEK